MFFQSLIQSHSDPVILTYRDTKKWRRREFVITKDSPIFSFQGVLASLPDQDDDDDGDDPPSTATTLVSSSPSPFAKVDDSACELPTSSLPDQSFHSPIHEKRKCRQFIRDLVRKVFPTSGGDEDCPEPEMNTVSRWSCSTGDSEWTAVSTSGSVDDRGGGELL